MSSLSNIQGSWKDAHGGDSVKVNLPVMTFKEDNVFVAYIPVLDLSGYGNTEQEAITSLTTVMDEYFTYTVRKKTLIEDLKRHGWTIKKKAKPYIAPEITDLINKNEYLHDIVNTKPYNMTRMPVSIPQCA